MAPSLVVATSLEGTLAAALDTDALVVFERGATWPVDLTAELAGRHGVVAIVQQREESYSDLLSRVRVRVERHSCKGFSGKAFNSPIGHVVWVGHGALQVPWRELLRSLFADDELARACVFRCYPDGHMDVAPEAVSEPPPRRSTLRALRNRAVLLKSS